MHENEALRAQVAATRGLLAREAALREGTKQLLAALWERCAASDAQQQQQPQQEHEQEQGRQQQQPQQQPPPPAEALLGVGAAQALAGVEAGAVAVDGVLRALRAADASAAAAAAAVVDGQGSK